jgi:hypothetical protein
MVPNIYFCAGVNASLIIRRSVLKATYSEYRKPLRANAHRRVFANTHAPFTAGLLPDWRRHTQNLEIEAVRLARAFLIHMLTFRVR